MELTDFQRIELANSYRLLAHSEDDDSPTKRLYQNIATALIEGYSEIYNSLLTDDGFVEESKAIPAEQQAEVLEDFEMYQFLINHGKKSDISFVGYDANNSTKYGFAMYVLDELGKYSDIKKLFLNKINSHGMDAFTDKKSSMILKYRELKRQGVLYSDEDSATKILEA
ncbi:YfbU family protein [Weissella confusa]|uniref:YfbU family protein n=1 Tax=Weissella confusa TaxID=1583 RepID=UPI00223BCEEE|nr:YfbU family protein [Weissella confusa]